MNDYDIHDESGVSSPYKEVFAVDSEEELCKTCQWLMESNVKSVTGQRTSGHYHCMLGRPWPHETVVYNEIEYDEYDEIACVSYLSKDKHGQS